MGLEEALSVQEEQVNGLLKSAERYVGALKTWKKACQTGHIGNLTKASAAAKEMAPALVQPVADVASAWDFDVRGYLESGAWREEIQQVSAQKFSLRVLEEGETLVSSPVILRAQPGKSTVQIGKVNWPNLRPALVAAELKKLRDRAQNANSAEFLDGLFKAASRLNPGASPFARFIDIYNLFSITPGWKKENPTAAFGQAIYALHRAELPTTRNGRRWQLEYPSGNTKPADVFGVIAEDGREIRYYGIQFL